MRRAGEEISIPDQRFTQVCSRWFLLSPRGERRCAVAARGHGGKTRRRGLGGPAPEVVAENRNSRRRGGAGLSVGRASIAGVVAFATVGGSSRTVVGTSSTVDWAPLTDIGTSYTIGNTSFTPVGTSFTVVGTSLTAVGTSFTTVFASLTAVGTSLTGVGTQNPRAGPVAHGSGYG